MTDVTIDNFHNLYPQIHKEIQNNTFLAIDCEFSGWNTTQCRSLFDDTSQRYLIEKENIEEFIILQFGLSIFKFDSNEHKFNVSTYSFPLLPLPYLSTGFRSTSCALRFLKAMGYDWNEHMGKALYYFSRSDRKRLLEKIRNGDLLARIETEIGFEIEETLNNIADNVKAWLIEKTPELILDNDIFADSIYFYYFKEIFANYPQISIQRLSASKIKLQITPKDTRSSVEIQDSAECILDEYLTGFTKVFEDICRSNKPLVGHNLLKDLMMIYQQFVGKLPNSYSLFKEEIHKLFPTIYDTKHLGYNLKNKVPKDIKCDFKSLYHLYRFMREGSGSNWIVFGPEFSSPPNLSAHNAGFDAYCTGYCFVQLAYFYSITVDGKLLLPKAPLRWTSSLNSLQFNKNCVNLVRGKTNFIRLDGKDPKSTRPLVLHVQSRSPLQHDQIVKICSTFHSVDVRTLSAYRTLLAFTNHRDAEEMKNLLEKDNLTVTYGIPWRYNRMLHKVSAISIVALLFCTTLRFITR